MTTRTEMQPPVDDVIVFDPRDVDLAKSPLRGSIDEETYILGAFNPGLTRLPGGNLLMMVRVAEALRQPIRDEHVFAMRWSEGRYVIDRYPRARVNDKDPRNLWLTDHHYRT